MSVKKYVSSLKIARSDYSDEELIEQLLTDFSHQIRMGDLPNLADYESKLRSSLVRKASVSKHIAYFYHQVSDWIYHAYDAGELAEDVLIEYCQTRHPKKIESYKIISLIGQGATSNVYSASDDIRGIEVCIKLERKEAIGKTDFSREAKINNALDHTQIVRIEQYGIHEGLQFMVSRIAPGVPLNEVGFGNHQDTAMFVAELCKPLIHAHVCGISHNDLKPENIYVDGEGVPRILDFGGADAAHLQLTDPLKVIQHTPAYRSPEQRDNADEIDHRSDIYSLGVMFFELLTGELPCNQTDPKAVNNSIPKPIAKTCQWMLAEHPNDRMQDLRQFENSISKPNRPVTKALIITAAIAVLAILSWFAGQYFRGRSETDQAQRQPVDVSEKTCSIEVPADATHLYIFPLIKGEPNISKGRELPIGEPFRLKPGEYEFSVVSATDHIRVSRIVPSDDATSFLYRCRSFERKESGVINIPPIRFAELPADFENVKLRDVLVSSSELDSATIRKAQLTPSNNISFFEAKEIAERYGMRIPSKAELILMHETGEIMNDLTKLEWSISVVLTNNGIQSMYVYDDSVAHAAPIGKPNIGIRLIKSKRPLVLSR